jgi:PH domain
MKPEMKNSEKKRRNMEQLREDLESLCPDTHGSTYSDLELDSFLTFHKSVPAAAKALLNARRWKEDNPVNIADVASYYRSPPGAKSPPAFLACLEDGQGGVARDNEGRPIIWMMGIIYGTKEELRQQLVYSLQRAARYRLPHHRPDEVCFVTEVMARESPNPLRLGMCSTFRFPDAAVRSLLDFMRATYPGSQFSVLHFCGLPSVVTGTFKMVKPFVSIEAFNRLNLKSNFSHLKRDGHVDPASLLPHWDNQGTFRFDLDEYVEWRAKEEGIAFGRIPHRGGGRSYESKSNPEDFGLTTMALLGSPEARLNVIKMGWVDKRGSGAGLFASNRWKSKYMVLTPGCLFYFESPKISASNVPSRMISIDGEASSVRRLESTEEGNDKTAMLQLLSEGREYIFGFSNEEEAEEWLQVLQIQCQSDDDGDASTGSASTIDPIMVYPASVSVLCVGAY